MAVNWGQLGSVQQPARVIAQLPQQSSTTDNVLGGIVSGMQAGQQMIGNAQNMKIQRAQEGRAEQMFPSQLQQSQQAAETGAMNLAGKKQDAQDAKDMRDTYDKGTDVWLKEGVKKYGPMFAVNYQKAKADADKVIVDIAEIRSRTGQVQNQVTDQYKIALGNIGATADQVYLEAHQQVMQGQKTAPNQPGLGILTQAGAQAQNAGQAAQLAEKFATQQAGQAFDIMFSHLDPVDQKVLQDKGLDKFSITTTGAFKSIAGDAHVRIQEEQDKKNATPTQKAQLYADQANNTLKQNPNDPHAQEVAANANAALVTASQGPKMVETPLEKINIQTSADAMKSAHEQSQKNIPIVANLEIYKQQMAGFTPGRFAETDLKLKSTLQGAAALFGIKPMNTNAGVAEQLDSISNQLKLQFASEIKNARMNVQMFKALSEIPPSIENTKQGAALIVDRLLYIKKTQNAYTDFQDQYIQKNNGNPQGVEKQWNAFLQNAPLLNKDGSTNVQHLQDDSTPYLNPNYIPPKNKESFSQNQFPSPEVAKQAQPQSFQKGQVVKDAHGNRATYIGGDPKDSRSYQELK